MKTTKNDAVEAALAEGMSVYTWHTHVSPNVQVALAANHLDLGLTYHDGGKVTDVRGNTVAKTEVSAIDPESPADIAACERWFFGD